MTVFWFVFKNKVSIAKTSGLYSWIIFFISSPIKHSRSEKSNLLEVLKHSEKIIFSFLSFWDFSKTAIPNLSNPGSMPNILVIIYNFNTLTQFYFIATYLVFL